MINHLTVMNKKGMNKKGNVAFFLPKAHYPVIMLKTYLTASKNIFTMALLLICQLYLALLLFDNLLVLSL